MTTQTATAPTAAREVRTESASAGAHAADGSSCLALTEDGEPVDLHAPMWAELWVQDGIVRVNTFPSAATWTNHHSPPGTVLVKYDQSWHWWPPDKSPLPTTRLLAAVLGLTPTTI